MISRISSPVRLSVLFNDREHRAGETIEVAIQLITGVRLDVTGAFVELLCTPGRGVKAPDNFLGNVRRSSESIHSKTVFSERRLIQAGAEEIFGAELTVNDNPPPPWVGPDPRWRLRVRFDLYDGTDISRVYNIRIKLD